MLAQKVGVPVAVELVAEPQNDLAIEFPKSLDWICLRKPLDKFYKVVARIDQQ